MKSVTKDKYKSKIDLDVATALFSEKSKFTTSVLASDLKPNEALLLRQALIYANMIRITYGQKTADLYIDGVLRTVGAYRMQDQKQSSRRS